MAVTKTSNSGCRIVPVTPKKAFVSRSVTATVSSPCITHRPPVSSSVSPATNVALQEVSILKTRIEGFHDRVRHSTEWPIKYLQQGDTTAAVTELQSYIASDTVSYATELC